MLFNFYLTTLKRSAITANDESFLGPNPTIASLSLGAGRKFQLTKKSGHKIKHEFFLEIGRSSHHARSHSTRLGHAIPKSGKPAMPRINITFRRAINTAGTNNYYRYNRWRCP
jgi:alkylated DNA repair dioxygenase AlkB